MAAPNEDVSWRIIEGLGGRVLLNVRPIQPFALQTLAAADGAARRRLRER